MPHFRTLLYTTQVVALAGHIFLYFTLVRFFGITKPSKKTALGGALFFLSVSFILASRLAHTYDNVVTRAYYFIAGAWLGLFFHLLIAALIGWLVVWALRASGKKPDTALVGLILFGLAAAYSFYGVYNAFNPKVTEVRVGVKGLPEDWRGRSIVQISDVHLGHVFRTEFLSRVVDTANALNPDMVVITGDLFDGMDGELDELTGPLSRLHAPYGVWFITGNHERHLGLDRVYGVMEGTGVEVLDDRVADVDGLQLAGVGYMRMGGGPPAEAMKKLPGYVPGKPTVLLYHSPVWVKENAAAGVGLQLSGHTHKGQLFPFGYVTHRIYDGYDYGLYKIGDYNLYTTNGTGAWGLPMRTGNTPEIVKVVLQSE